MSYTYLAEKSLYINNFDLREDDNFDFRYINQSKNQTRIGGYRIVYCGSCHNVTPFWQWNNYELLNEKKKEIELLLSDKTNEYQSLKLYNNEDGLNYILQEVLDQRDYFLSMQDVTSILGIKDDFLPNDFDKNPKEYICPICGAKIKYANMHRLERTKKWKEENLLFDSLNISEENDKIIFSLFTISVFPVTQNNKLKISKINFRIVFNKETSQIYLLQPYDMDEKKFITKYDEKEIRKITNITYLSDDYNKMDALSLRALNLTELSNKMAKYACKLHHTTLKATFNKDYELVDVLLYLRYYNCSKETRNCIKEICEMSFINKATAQKRKRILSEILEMQNSYDAVISQMKKKKCPLKKKLKKMVLQNLHIIYLYRTLTRIGFKDYNVILNIIEQYPQYHIFLIKLYCGLLPILEDNNFVKQYFQWILKNTTDVLAKKYIFDWQTKENHNLWMSKTLDTARLYIELKLAIDDTVDFPLTANKTNVLHDEISRLLPKYKSSNVRIPYKQKDMKYNCDIDDISFRLAPDTFSLIDCGEQMGICVGGYRNSALTKVDTIIFMIQNNRFVGCIELSPTNRLIQAKAKFNNKLQENKALALKQYVETLKIDTTKCYDYIHIAKDNIIFKQDDNTLYNHGHNYAISRSETVMDSDINTIFDVEYKIIDK